MEIVPHVHQIPGVMANPYLILDGDDLTLIDVGMPGNHKRILEYIAEIGHTPSELKRILITHSDLDHVGSLRRLQKATGARTYASAIEAAAIARGKSSRTIKPRKLRMRLLIGIFGSLLKGAPGHIDELLTDGQSLPVLGGLTVLETAGHTPGHVSFYSPSTGVLFAGDSIISRDNQLVGSLPANTWDQTKAAEAVRKQTALSPRVVCSGHGPVVKDAAGKMPVV